MAVNITRDSLKKWADSKRQDFEATLGKLIEIPTVSAQPEHKRDIQRGVDYAVEIIRRFGGQASVIHTEGNPIVHAHFSAGNGARTVTIYNHLDVQPASRETEPWDEEPFVFQKKGDKYLGRGTTDDKGPAISALFGALAAREAGVPLNINLLWEFEEEIGSPNFEAAITSARDQLKTDSVIVSDTQWISRDRPALAAGLRGMAGFRFVLETAGTDQHSGSVGGAARNPLAELMKLSCELHDATTGKIKIPGFYDDVAKLTKKDLRDFKDSGFSVKKFKQDHGLKSLRVEDPLDVMKRIWALPTCEIHGLVGGYTGPGLKTVVPPRGELKVTFRLVPNQNPNKISKLVKAYVKKHNPDVQILHEKSMFPYLAPTTGPLADKVRAAVKFAWGKDAVFVREGGSIGAVISMEKVLRCPVMFLGLSLPEHGYHAPNENFDWQQASGGMIAFAKYFHDLSEMK
jgi:acetylornithine deacetylase/succinyl-diaminopimelate desuccinylase-like protein